MRYKYMNKSAIVVLFSGGLDSTAMLYKYLIETDYNIYAHYIYLINIGGQYKVAKVAVNNCVNWLKKNTRGFIYSTSTIDITFNIKEIAPTDQIQGFVAGQIAAKNTIPNLHFIARGLISTDRSKTLNARKFERTYNSIFDSENSVPIIYPLRSYSKKELIKELPEELLKLTWSCITPIYKDNYAYPCNNCINCENIKMTKIKHNIIKLNE